ncbi:hypothetical protein AAHA92_00356 [Salvia divinorum]|uniref:Uncharacterized protein n=1 Tax=Salvia divinorum TaxID=28513 RepID=A0ABD1IJY5_SALDI
MFALFSEELRKAFESKIEIAESLNSQRWTKHAKNGMTRGCGEGIVLVDEKARKKQRYKELCNSFMKLAVKVAESEDSYTYAIDCLLKMGNDVDGMVGKANNVSVEANKVGDISTDGEVNENQIKGVKPKGRVTYQTRTEGTTLINDEYWNLTFTAFDHQSAS